jgi:hypothetical protein
MEILLFCMLIGACFTRPQREPARPGFWRRLLGFRGEEDPKAPKEMESRLHVRQELDKKSKRMWTRISYRENGRSVSVKCQENMTLAFAGMVLKLEPSGVQVQDAQGKAFQVQPAINVHGKKIKPWPLKVTARQAEGEDVDAAGAGQLF